LSIIRGSQVIGASNSDVGHVPLLQRQVRRLLAEGRIPSYEKGELVVKLQEMEFAEEEALVAAENCDDIYTATKFLRQECELCANVMNVTEVISRLNFVNSQITDFIIQSKFILQDFLKF